MASESEIERILPKENLLGFRGAYLETAQPLRSQQGKGDGKTIPTNAKFMDDLLPLPTKRAHGCEISGLSAYEG